MNQDRLFGRRRLRQVGRLSWAVWRLWLILAVTAAQDQRHGQINKKTPISAFALLVRDRLMLNEGCERTYFGTRRQLGDDRFLPGDEQYRPPRVGDLQTIS
jgi:hypothetical protein